MLFKRELKNIKLQVTEIETNGLNNVTNYYIRKNEATLHIVLKRSKLRFLKMDG